MPQDGTCLRIVSLFDKTAHGWLVTLPMIARNDTWHAECILVGMTEKRISQLLDMMIQHMIYGRTDKALKIGQYLRDHFGCHLADVVAHTGYRAVR